MRIKQFITKSNIGKAGNLIFIGLLLLLLLNPDAKSWVLKQLISAGLFRAEIKKAALDGNSQAANVSFDFREENGKISSTASLKGKVVFINFWATWCPPCRAEMPSLQQLAEIYGPEQLQVLALNVGEGPRRIAQYLQSSGLELTVLLDPKSEAAKAWGASVLPTTILIDAEGRPRQRVRGEVDWSGREAQALVEPLLRSPLKPGART